MLFSFVIPSFNSRSSIQACLDSIQNQSLPDSEICVIDDGSVDSTAEFISKHYPRVYLVRNPENKGAAFSRNQGINTTAGEWIVFLDADAALEKDFTECLKKTIQSLGPDYAGVTAKIKHRPTNRLFSCGLEITSLYRSHDVLKGKAASAVSAPFEVNGFNSCCAAIRRSCLDEVREKGMYFDEDFFFLFEDTDLSLRLKKRGYKFWFAPELRCSHQGGSAPIDPQKRRFYSFRNRFYLIIKNETNLRRFFLRSFFYDVPRTLHFYLTNPYARQAQNDVLKKIQNEKNTHF
jgi:GT2 family glycosyltransferase